MEITRSGILRDCLEEANREMHKYSRHNAGLLPLEGYENHFAESARIKAAGAVAEGPDGRRDAAHYGPEHDMGPGDTEMGGTDDAGRSNPAAETQGGGGF